jgi:hypothetical protein
LPRFGECRQENANEDGNDTNDNQQLDEGERLAGTRTHDQAPSIRRSANEMKAARIRH